MCYCTSWVGGWDVPRTMVESVQAAMWAPSMGPRR